ncbi:uncharacterized protein T551_00519 [Pneumocystis jirovecii RU7]|uniref:Actin cytoskeleton-regulatory complex protein PAN1 n=1 Tax=Pneumocystis jirovecii (strain RU7) TaxID=1408657 RepID=A0A0W4ZVN1_PNEJ7|nr:uncharacterized protein T551_00519 [Pneumocystis jirovecii RU7]KTW32429.1 hypothetical protein T551_00519 [Pneumocystis jirovecii RU7]
MNTNPYSTPQIENLQRATYSGDSQQPLHAPAARDLAFSGLQTGHLSGSINSENIDTRNMPYFGEGGSIQAQTGAPGTQIGASLLSGRKTGKMRLSFVTSSDQARFEDIFRSAVGENIVISGEIAKSIMSKSCLTPSVLAKIWEHADTTKSGQLMMPEFVLAMHLCSMAMSGKSVPDKIPETIYDEVFDVVSSILLSVPDTSPSSWGKNAQNMKTSGSSQHGAPGLGGTQVIQPMQATQGQGGLQSSQTGPISQVAGFQTPFMQMPGGFQPLSPLTSNIQPQIHTGSAHYTDPMHSGMTGVSNYGMKVDNTAIQGQWSGANIVQRKTSGIYALQSQLMPQTGRKEGIASVDMSGASQSTWAMYDNFLSILANDFRTKDEKQVYDNIFKLKAWGGLNTGFIDGKTAVEIFSQSNLSKKDLELIWNLADSENRGKLNIDEFSIALHLVYRKINGYEIPLKLPQELVLQSSKNFSDSVSQVKSLLRNLNSHEKKSFSSQITDYTKLQSSDNDPFEIYSKNISKYKQDNYKIEHISDFHKKESLKNFDSFLVTELKKKDTGQLDKFIKNREEIPDITNIQNEKYKSEIKENKNEIKHLYRQIRHIQEEINNHPDSSLLLLDLNEKHVTLKYELEDLSDELPSIISRIRKVQQEIADAKLELFKLQDVKNYPESNAKIMNNKETTDSNKRNTEAAATLRAQMAILTGDLTSSKVNDYDRRYSEAVFNINKEKESNENTISSIEESAEQLKNDLEYKLKNFKEKFLSSNDERKKWNEGLNVQNEIKEFISDLKKTYKPQEKSNSNFENKSSDISISTKQSIIDFSKKPLSNVTHKHDSTYTSLSIDKNKDKAAWIKAEAERRMNERLAAMGIEPYKRLSGSNDSLIVNEKQSDIIKEAEERRKKDEEYQKERERARLLRIEKENKNSLSAGSDKQSTFIDQTSRNSKNNQNILDMHSKILNEKFQEKDLTEEIVQKERIKKSKDTKSRNTKKTSEIEKKQKKNSLQHDLQMKEERLRKLKEEMKAKKQEEILLRRKQDEMEKEIKRLSLENNEDYQIKKNDQLKAQTQYTSETNPFQYNTTELHTSSNKLNNPFSTLQNQNKSDSSLDTLHTASSTRHSSPHMQPISKILHSNYQTDSNTWSISQSTSDNDNSDDSTTAKKNPSQLASILIGAIESGKGSPYLIKNDSPKTSTTELFETPSHYLPSLGRKSPSSPTANRDALLNQIQKGTKLKKTPAIQPRSSSIVGKV